MNEPERTSIFREDARRRYFQQRVERVLPRLATPALFRSLWLIAIILMVAVAAIGWSELLPYIAVPATLREAR